MITELELRDRAVLYGYKLRVFPNLAGHRHCWLYRGEARVFDSSALRAIDDYISSELIYHVQSLSEETKAVLAHFVFSNLVLT